MDKDRNNTTNRAEFYSDLPREIVEMLMNDDIGMSEPEKPDIKEENTNTIDDSTAPIDSIGQASSFAEPQYNRDNALEYEDSSPSALQDEDTKAIRQAPPLAKEYSPSKPKSKKTSRGTELENMFDDVDKGRHKRGTGGAGVIIALIIFILLTGYFGYHYLLSKTYLIKSEAVEAQAEDLQAKYDALKLENMALQEEIKVLNGELVLHENTVEEVQTETPTVEETHTAQTPAEPSSQTYTIENGDTFWSIAQKFYGNGAEFQKILDANGLTENSRISAGDTLIIPN